MTLRPEFEDGEYTIANDPVNIDKHRDRKVMAADKYRAYLQSYSVNRTDYINAVILPVSWTELSPKVVGNYVINVLSFRNHRHTYRSS